MKLAIPEGFVLPEDLAEGDTFEELVTFRLDEGELVPVSIAGIAIPDEEETADEEALEEEVDMSMGAISDRVMGL